MNKICAYTQETNIFFLNVGPRFNKFKRNIAKIAKQNKIPFDEDVFMDTIIKCSNTFNNEDANDIDIDNYFWIAYKQNIFSTFSRDKFKDVVNFDDITENIIYEEYNADIDDVVDLIKSEVKKEFGDKIYDAWILHICNNKSYTELDIDDYKGLNLHNEFRQIKRFIFNKLIKNNKKLKTLLIENDFL
jgi:hypothetical protein